jgi:hypothetical protein
MIDGAGRGRGRGRKTFVAPNVDFGVTVTVNRPFSSFKLTVTVVQHHVTFVRGSFVRDSQSASSRTPVQSSLPRIHLPRLAARKDG